jgi:glucosamine-6-phosphate deaminase
MIPLGGGNMRKLSTIAKEWWDYTTIDDKILEDAAKLGPDDLVQLSRPGFQVRIYETREEFFLAEALEYIEAWRSATRSRPAGICGPIGPTEQLPLVAALVNALELNLRDCHFWGMDEWVGKDGRSVGVDFPLGFAKADMDLCFGRVRKDLAMPKGNLHFPSSSALSEYTKTYDDFRCVLMQGGQGETKHWAFNDPLRREGKYKDAPPSPEEFRALSARVVELHPATILQNARTSGGGVVSSVPTHALSVGPLETWKAETVSIWHPGWHDNPFGQRLTAFMISKRIIDSAVPMSLLADHPDVRFSYLRSGIGSCSVEMH